MDKKSIGSFIAVLRKSNGMTQQDLADRLSVSNKTVSKWECDEGYPDLMLIPAIAEVFNVTCDEILNGGRINKDIPSDKNILKIEKQIDRLIKSTISKSKIFTCICMAIAISGFIMLFIIAYGLFRPYIGLGIQVLFTLGSSVLMIIQFISSKSAINTSEMFNENDLRKISCDIKINRCLFYLIIVNSFLLILGIPIGIKASAYATIMFYIYANEILPSLVIILFCVFISVYTVYHLIEQRKYKSYIGKNYLVQSKLRRLNIIIPTVMGVLILICFIIPLIIYQSNLNDIEDGSYMLGPSVFTIVYLLIILFIVYIALSKKILKELL